MKTQKLTIKKIIVIASVVLLASCSKSPNTAVPNSDESINIPALNNYDKFVGGAQITFNEYDFDFGTVSKENKLHHTFYFVNSGDTPLIISDAKGSCGCTIPFFPKDPINPGQQEKIDIEIDPSGKKEGSLFKVAVRIESNADNKYVKLNLSGTPEVKAEETQAH
jgi:hypothetical protein